MACILGQRSKSAPGTPQEQSEVGTNEQILRNDEAYTLCSLLGEVGCKSRHFIKVLYFQHLNGSCNLVPRVCLLSYNSCSATCPRPQPMNECKRARPQLVSYAAILRVVTQCSSPQTVCWKERYVTTPRTTA